MKIGGGLGPETLCATGKEAGKLLSCNRERSRAVTAHMVVCHQNQCTLSCAGEAAQCFASCVEESIWIGPRMGIHRCNQ